MPIYAYQCAACGHHFDRLQKLSDADPDACPACGATGEVKRQLTAPSFRLAGSGWYETDFKKDGDRKRNLVEGGEGAGKQVETTTDGGDKPATKTAEPAKPAPDAKSPAKVDVKPAAAKPASDA